MDKPAITPESATELTLVEAIPLPVIEPNPKQAQAAIKRCCAAWQRTYDVYLAGTLKDKYDKIEAVQEAGRAYCKAMPPLAGYESIRDFLACAAHGILIKAIPQQRANQLSTPRRSLSLPSISSQNLKKPPDRPPPYPVEIIFRPFSLP